MHKLLVLIITIFLATQSNAKEEILTISGHPDYPPVIWMSKTDKKMKGVAVELTEKILSEINIKTKNYYYETWGRALEQVKQGHIDLLLPPYLTEERKEEYIFSDIPFMIDRSSLFIKKGTKLEFKDFKDLKKYSGVALINDSFGDKFDKTDKEVLNIRRLKKTEQCLKYLDKGRADYLIAGENAGMSVVYLLGLEDSIELHPKPIIETGMFIAISKNSKFAKDQKIMNHINKRLKEISKTTFIKDLEKKYLEEYKKEPKD